MGIWTLDSLHLLFRCIDLSWGWVYFACECIWWVKNPWNLPLGRSLTRLISMIISDFQDFTRLPFFCAASSSSNMLCLSSSDIKYSLSSSAFCTTSYQCKKKRTKILKCLANPQERAKILSAKNAAPSVGWLVLRVVVPWKPVHPERLRRLLCRSTGRDIQERQIFVLAILDVS